MSECEFNHEGFCIAAEEFPEMKDNPCHFNKDGLCTAKDSDLTYVCPDCYRENCDGNCGDCNLEEKVIVPKRVSGEKTNE